MHDAMPTRRLEFGRRPQLIVALLLAAVLILTRGHHFPTLTQAIPSASWAIFFLAGVYLRAAWPLAALLVLAAAVDYAAIAWGGVSDFCVSPTYAALVPAYGALWVAGRWYATRYRFALSTLLPLGLAIGAGTVACEVISSGSFYFYSGRVTEPTAMDFARALLTYLPRSLQSVMFWVVVAMLTHVTWSLRHSLKLSRLPYR